MKSRALKRFCALFLAGALTLTAVQVPAIGVNAEAWTWSETQSQGGYEKVGLKSATADSHVETSQEQNGASGPEACAIDGNPDTYWHSDWSGSNDPDYDEATDTLTGKNTITIELAEAQAVEGVTYLPRPDKGGNGLWTNFKVEVSTDGVKYDEAYATSENLVWDINANDQATWTTEEANQEREFIFSKAYAGVTHVKFTINQSTGAESKHRHICAAEIGVLKAKEEAPKEVDKTALYEAIAAAKEKVESDYTEGWDGLQEALTAAEAVMNKADATEEDVSGAIEALNAAVEALKAKDADRKALEDLVASNDGRVEAAYQTEGWTAFAEKLQAAKDALNEDDATADDLKAAAEALQEAVDALEMKEIPVVYTQDAFDITITNETDAYKTDADKKNVEKLIELGNYDGLFDRAFGRDFELKYDVTSDTNVSIPLALHLEFKNPSRVDKILLHNAAEGNGYVTKVKTTVTYAEDQETEPVEKTVENEQIFEFDYSDTATKLVKKIDIEILEARTGQNPTTTMMTLAELEVKNLEIKPEDKAILEETIKDVQAGKNKDDYLKEGWTALEAAVKAAEEVVADEDASKEAIADAVQALRDAEAGLVTKENGYKVYGLSDFDITITNEELDTDDGTNVKTLIQQEKYDGLFNNVLDREFELLWNQQENWEEETGALPAYVTLPVTLHLEFNKPVMLDENGIVLYNDPTKAGDGEQKNGYVTKAQAQVFYADGTQSEIQKIEEQADTYTFAVDNTKAVKKIEVTPLEAYNHDTHAVASNMLTIAELQVYGPYVRATDIELAEENPTTIKVDETATVNATVAPEYAVDTSYVISSSDEEVVKVETAEDGTQQIVGVAEGYATITATASDDSTVKDSYTVKVEGKETEPGPGPGPDKPDVDPSKLAPYGQDAFKITMTNAVLTDDEDGTNVELMTQQQSYDGLFNGEKLQEYPGSRDFELLWNIESNYDPDTGAMPTYVALPFTLHLTFNTPSKVFQVLLYNANKANGYITSAKAVLNYEDGTTSEVQIDDSQATYTFNFTEDKAVKSVDITPLTAVASDDSETTNMATIAEIEVMGPAILVTGIKAADDNVKAIKVGESTPINAVISPENASNKAFTATSSNEEIVRVVSSGSSYQALGVEAGTATITVAAAEDSSIKDTYEIVVSVNKDDLQAVYDANKDKTADAYTEDSWTAFKEALDAAKAVLDKANATQAEIDSAKDALTAAAAALTEKAGEADLAALQAAIDAGKDLKEADYTADSWAAYQAALDAAKELLTKENPSKEEIESAVAALEAAQNALVKNPEEEKFPFVDVKEGDYFYNAVKYVNNNKIMTGVDKTHFAPYDTLVRAQFATTLYRMEGKPDVKYSKTFKDVPDGWFYTEAVLWAAKDDVRVVTGYTNGNFGPNDTITREQMAAMMYRYAKYKEYDVKVDATLDKYPDKDKVSDYAKKAMEWCVGKGIITGKGEKGATKTLDPQGNATRAECATILQRFLKAYAE